MLFSVFLLGWNYTIPVGRENSLSRWTSSTSLCAIGSTEFNTYLIYLYTCVFFRTVWNMCPYITNGLHHANLACFLAVTLVGTECSCLSPRSVPKHKEHSNTWHPTVILHLALSSWGIVGCKRGPLQAAGCNKKLLRLSLLTFLRMPFAWQSCWSNSFNHFWSMDLKQIFTLGQESSFYTHWVLKPKIAMAAPAFLSVYLQSYCH